MIVVVPAGGGSFRLAPALPETFTEMKATDKTFVSMQPSVVVIHDNNNSLQANTICYRLGLIISQYFRK